MREVSGERERSIVPANDELRVCLLLSNSVVAGLGLVVIGERTPNSRSGSEGRTKGSMWYEESRMLRGYEYEVSAVHNQGYLNLLYIVCWRRW